MKNRFFIKYSLSFQYIIVNILFNGIDFKSLLIIVIAISWFIISYWIMNVPKMEHDALIRFMEDLED